MVSHRVYAKVEGYDGAAKVHDFCKMLETSTSLAGTNGKAEAFNAAYLLVVIWTFITTETSATRQKSMKAANLLQSWWSPEPSIMQWKSHRAAKL